MRIGYNPNKDKEKIITDYFHQVIMPVYIPNNEGYFKDSFEIFKYSLQSLFKTSHDKTYFSIINNGSSTEVKEYIDDLFQNGKINEVIHVDNIGKLNAILKGISGHNFQFITVTDADVLFMNDWQSETYKVYENFPKTGAVSTTPSSKVVKQFTSNVIIENLFSRKLKFSPVLNKQAFIEFSVSIGNPDFYNEHQLNHYLTIQNSEFKAVIGAPHFVATYRSDVFSNYKKKYSNYSLGGDSENELLDEPVLNKGCWRLSTCNNYTYHMGNVKEQWMFDKFNSIEFNKNVIVPAFNFKSTSTIKNKIEIFVYNKIISKKIIWQTFLRFKGLSYEASKRY